MIGERIDVGDFRIAHRHIDQRLWSVCTSSDFPTITFTVAVCADW